MFSFLPSVSSLLSLCVLCLVFFNSVSAWRDSNRLEFQSTFSSFFLPSVVVLCFPERFPPSYVVCWLSCRVDGFPSFQLATTTLNFFLDGLTEAFSISSLKLAFTCPLFSILCSILYLLVFGWVFKDFCGHFWGTKKCLNSPTQFYTLSICSLRVGFAG